MKHMKKQIIFLVPAALFMIALVSTVPAFASNDEGSGNAGSDVSCSPITGNPNQEKCGGGGIKEVPTGDGCTNYVGPEDTVTHTPRVTVKTC
jgi:hypothetical protein